MHPRVLQIGKHFYPDRGGIETVTRNVSDALSQHGIGADVLCMGLHSEGDRQEDGYRVIRSRSNAIVAGNKTLSWDYVRQIRRLSSQYDVGILHLPNPLGAAAVLAFWRRPLILLWHADFQHRVLELITRPIDIAIAKRADAVIAPTMMHLSTSNRAVHLVHKGEAVPFPIASTPPRPGHSSALINEISRAARGRKIVLAAGRLVPYKGFDVLIRAMKDTSADLYCVIAGGGPLRESLEQQVMFDDATDKVMLTGPVDDADMAALLELAHFGCLPSVTAQEMYGLTQIEMMAVHKPMISTNLPGSGVPLVNRHGETGLLAEPGDVLDLSRQLNALSTDATLYDRLARGARQMYETAYSPRTVGAQYASLVRRVARSQ